MRDYAIITDSSCDLPAALAEELQLTVVPLSVLIDGKNYTNYLDEREISHKDFYALLRAEKTGVTSAPNTEQFVMAMEPFLQEGMDVLYLGFSSALSGSCNAGMVAAQELLERYPQATILAVDTLCASMGEGLLVYHAVQQKRAGKSIEEVRDFVEQNKLHLCHWFTVNDLNHLRRGGRVSSATALVGTMLNIKPVMHVDNEGRLVAVDKVRGRKNSLIALCDRMECTVVRPQEQIVFISHGDCEDEARFLAELIRDRMKVKDILLNYVGPVIGAHSGPGTMALFFLGDHR